MTNRKILERTNGPNLEYGWHQMIIYRNKTSKSNMATITIMGMYTGNPDKKWSFTIEDMEENILYESSEYSFVIFPEGHFADEIFDAPVENIPDEFIIKLTTGSDPDNSLFILLLEDTKHVFSFEYKDQFTYNELDNMNYCIFPEFR